MMKRLLLTAAGTISGFIIAAVLSATTTALLRNAWPVLGSATQGPLLETLDAAYALAYMGLGGYVAARLGGVRAGYVLAGLFFMLSLTTAAFGLDSIHSAVYQWVLVPGAVVTTLTGAWLARRRAEAIRASAKEDDVIVRSGAPRASGRRSC